MEFLNPWFWLGAAAVAGPILLHLVQKERKERIPFSSLLLMPRAPIKQMRRRRLKHLFLLFLRCLGIVLIVAAFTRPVATGAWFDRINPLTARSVVILLDHSMSMSRPEVWSKAIAAATEKIGSLGDSDEGKLVLFGDAGEVASQWEAESARLIQILSQVAPSYESTSYLDGLRLAVDQFKEERNPRKEIYLITDLQRSGLSATDGWKVPAEISVELEDVGKEDFNLYVDEARLERNVFGKSYPRPVLLRLAHIPPQATAGQAQLFIEGKLVDRQTFSLSEQGAGQLTFKPFELGEGVSRGRIVIEPSDAMPSDNSFHFVLERQEPRQILIVARGSSAFYLQQALASGDNLPFAVSAVRSLPSQLSSRDVPLVILDDLAQLPSSAAMRRYVEEGGGLILSLAGETRREAFDEAWQELLPARLTERKFVRSGGKPFTAITQVNWEHPVFNIFQDVQKASVASAQFYSYWRLEPKAGAVAIARFDEGDPALVERTVGDGRIIVYSSSLDSTWTDFPVRSAYLPLWHRLVQYASRWEASPAALRINQSIRPAAGGDGGTWDVLDPTGKRVLGLEQRDPGALQLKMPGHYEIRENKGTDWVAANTPPAESDLTRIPAGDIQAVFIPSQSRAATETEASYAAKERQQSLWWLFLLAAGVVLSIESVVANRSRLRT